MQNQNVVKFNRHFVANKNTGKKCRIYYALDNRTDGRKCVTLYAKSYTDSLEGVLPFQNGSDFQQDYFEKDRAVIFEGDPLYADARAAVEALKTHRKAKTL